MTIYILVNGNCKSWAFGLEIAYKYTKISADIKILDLSNIMSFRASSLRKKSFSRIFVKERNINYFKSSFFSIHRVTAFRRALEATFKYKHSKILELNRNIEGKINHNAIVHCALSQFFGTANYSKSEIPLWILVRYSFKSYLSEQVIESVTFKKQDVLYVFNGRKIIESVCIQQALNSGVQVKITERASSPDKFEIYNTSPHFHPEWWEKITNYSRTIHPNNSVIRDKADKYIENKLKGFDSFTNNKWEEFYYSQDNFLSMPDKPYVVFLSTSSFEFSPISEYNSTLGYASQDEAVVALKTICRELNYPLVIRRHPNSLSPFNGKDFDDRHWQKFSDSNTLIIGPKDKVNTLNLSKNSRVVFAWRSSVGIETLSLGIPTYALGTAKWAWINDVRAWDPDQIRNAINQPKVGSPDILEAYNFYFSSGGTELKLFKRVERWGVELNDGRVIYNKILERTWNKSAELLVKFGLVSPRNY
jgi:hypothetical protein